MSLIQKLILPSLCALAVLGTVSSARATPISGSFDLTIWSANTPNSNINSANQQATATNPLNTHTDLVYSGTYTGAINFQDPSAGSDTVAGFIATAGGALSGNSSFLNNIVLSAPNFTHASLFDFEFTTTAATTFTVTHDDGFSIWNVNNTSEVIGSYAGPTSEDVATVTLAADTTYNLWYEEANGLPADLIMSTVPEPGSVALLGMGLVGLGALTRRRASTPSVS